MAMEVVVHAWCGPLRFVVRDSCLVVNRCGSWPVARFVVRVSRWFVVCGRGVCGGVSSESYLGGSV